ncbi:secreted and transmembrane protein 1 isoform X2 [Dipodomys spectabilis]|uniref:secreted and transmembrane protein 1 isoform X2 n=1 Tax=Dipodomys spectabilis TaxID=105255 RepID=UPI001C5470B1|nr:secreted and transmembrane protein 1 isoform X2 [Dipodomys spectabilis]
MTNCPAVPGHWPRVLGALLLLAASLNTQSGSRDDPVCTEGVVSVARGQRAVMTCNLSNPITHITIQLSAHGVNRTVFSEDAPGHFSRGEWQLQVQGGQAQLVVRAAQDSHAGLYLWHLYGHQRNSRVIILHVSGTKTKRTGGELRPWTLVGVMVALLFSVLVAGALARRVYTRLSRALPRTAVWSSGPLSQSLQPKMPTRHRATPSRIARVLGVLLLLDAALSTQNERWDDPACTEGVVSVSRGQRAEMTCNISNPFTCITVSLSSPGADGTLFRVEPSAGRSRVSRDGWQLLVQGGRAQLVVESAQDRHAGLYSWRLRGCQTNLRQVYLNVSRTDGTGEPQDPQLAADLGLAMSSRVRPEASTWPRSRGGALASVLMLGITVLGLLSWYRTCHSRKFQQMPSGDGRASGPDWRWTCGAVVCGH